MKSVVQLRAPYLVQRCTVEEGKVRYGYMGSTEFEIGDQAKALKRIFAAGIEEAEVTVMSASGKPVTVYMVVGKGFDPAAYQPHLQALTENKLRLKEWTNFDDAVTALTTKIELAAYKARTNAWFDFTGENAVLWTLSRENQRKLTAALRDIQKKWSEKK